ncbi:MAG TPA: OstA-like protein, partial [Chitinophagaceae bacterium]|nr:OstA-like protein [Chitinophagaceae bacterium]
MQYAKFIFCLFFAGLTISPVISFAQVIPPPSTTTSPESDSLVNIEILDARKLEFRKVNDSTQLQILAGYVKLKQGTSFFWCDSCVINNNTKTFEAWGHVHINDSDTANIYASHMRYFIDKKIAYLDGGVKLSDGKGELTTPDLEYDMTTDIGTYLHGGRVINKNSVLTSQEGHYYAGLRDIYFKGNVELKDPAYYIKTDSLIYNTQSQTTRFIAQTFIKDSSGRTVETKDGYYNIATGKAEFGQNSVIHDGSRIITARKMAFDDSAGTAQFSENAVIIDTAQHTILIANNIFSDNKRERMLATGKPLMIVKQEDDSIYITADTLFSARLSDLYGKKDSIVKDTVKGTKVVSVNNKDSSNRYFEAYRHVRIFSDSLQSVCDSLFYSFKDSTFR